MFKAPTKEEMDRIIAQCLYDRAHAANSAVMDEVSRDDEPEQPQPGTYCPISLNSLRSKKLYLMTLR